MKYSGWIFECDVCELVETNEDDVLPHGWVEVENPQEPENPFQYCEDCGDGEREG